MKFPLIPSLEAHKKNIANTMNEINYTKENMGEHNFVN